MVKGKEHFLYQEKLRAGTVHSGEEKTQEGSHLCTYLEGGCEKMETGFFNGGQ